MNIKRTIVSASVFILFGCLSTFAQTSAFTYQGKLTNGGVPANGIHTFEFKLFDNLVTPPGVQQGTTVMIPNVTVTDGVFTVALDFGAGVFTGANRFLEISVQGPGSPFILLSPRQPLTSSPYAVQTLRASSADVASNITGVVSIFNGGTGLSFNNQFPVAGLYLRTSGIGWAASGIDVSDVPGGSTNYIQNRSTPQPSTNFNISGNGTVGGTLSGNGSGLTNLNGANLNPGSVITEKLAVGAVTTEKLADASVTIAKLQPEATALITSLSLLGALRWDLLSVQAFSAGSLLVSIASDGQNVWVASQNSNALIKLGKDGSVLGSFTAGHEPKGVVFDGARIWVISGDDRVRRFRPSDGLAQGVFVVGDNPKGIAFDGENIWTANYDDSSLTKLKASDGSVQGTFLNIQSPRALVFDGENIWVANEQASAVSKVRASDGFLCGKCTFAVGGAPVALAFDGTNIWVANQNTNNVTKLRASDGELQGTFGVGLSPSGIAFDGASIWVANKDSNNITKLRASDGAIQGTLTTGSGPIGVAFDGYNIWVTNSISNTVMRMPRALP